MIHRLSAIGFIAVVWVSACTPPGGGTQPAPVAPSPPGESATTRIAATGDEEAIMEMESEPSLHEDRDGLAALIGQLSAPTGNEGPPPQMVIPEDDGDSEIPAETGSLVATRFSSVIVPDAAAISALTFPQCRALLREASIRVRDVSFDTPFVAMPLLLDSPVEGVAIAPRWPGKGEPRGEVMDCRLIVAFIALARAAAERDAVEIRFYSTYRPLARPDETCPAGRDGRTCRARRDAWKKAESGRLSQHHRAMAIDIHGFKMAGGRYVTVLDGYERHDGQPPCDDVPTTPDGIFLKDLACTLHAQKAFQVMLTPNANKAHHNHFHFDITAGATWYIIR